ncbi:MAG TPA: hypothetical protein VHC69_23565 [Polyangiaceae bacterium]|nr:hypothetical protein [Polyangiaceae bacterium]
MTSRRSRGTPWTLIIVGVVGLVAVGGFLFLRLRSQGALGDPSAAGSGSSVSELEALLDAPAGSAGIDPQQAHILSKTSLADAIEAARPMMSNTVGRLDLGSAMLAMWASKNLSWQALEALPETSPALFKKDPDAERGRRFCMSGTVLEIRAEKTMANRLVEDKSLPLIDQAPTQGMDSTQGTSHLQGDTLASASASAASPIDPALLGGMDFSVPDGGKVYFATLQSKADESEGMKMKAAPRAYTFVEVIAVRSSGSLVDGSDARVCGVLTGVTVPPGAATTGASMDSATVHRIVGMFDLPQNRAPNGVEVAAQHG